jgi:hypothetical protein
MAIRLYSEFTSDQGTNYKVELHDSDWLGGSYEFELGGDGFTLNYTGETDDIISPIISSECEIGVALRTGQVLNYFDALKTYQENRFRVVIYTNDSYETSQAYRQRVLDDGGTFEAMECVEDAIAALGGESYRLFWVGWVMQDLVTLEDASEPYFMTLKAVDGIGRLANLEYTDANNITQNGLGITRSNIIIYNCLKAAGTYDLWGASDAFLETCVDWWEVTKMTYATTDDPLYLSGIDVGLFASKDDDGNTVRLTYVDVLKQLATLWNSRVYLTEGRFVFEQVGARAAATRYISQYDKTGVVIANPSVSDDIIVDQTSGNARLAGNMWDFLPALKKVSVTYAQRFLSPWFGAGAFNDSNTTQTIGFVSGGQGIQLAFYGPYTYTLTSSTGASTNDIDSLSPVFRAEIRVEDGNNPGTYYYYSRAYNGYSAAKTFDSPLWTTTQSYYYFDIGADEVSGGAASIYNIITITTSDIPVSGSLRFTLEFWKPVDLFNDTDYILEGHQTEVWNAVIAFSRTDDGQAPASGEIFTSTNSSSAIGSNLTLDLGEIYIGDGALQTGDLLVFNSSTSAWDSSQSWRKGNSGTGVPILKLMTSEALALHSKPIQRYNGTIMSNPSFQPRLFFDGAYYLKASGTFTASQDEWNGVYFPISRDAGSITAADPIYLDRTPQGKTSSTSGAGNTPNELNIGKVGGMQLDAPNQKLGPFQQVATGGKVNGTFQATGAATMSSSLTIAGDTDFEGSHTALIQDVTHNDGTEYTVETTDFIIFNKWEGANGQAYVNLPRVADSEGRMIRFKSDDTISANTYVTLRPDAVDTSATIDGETSVDFNRSYDGIMVLCHSNQWYIVQRKSK